METGIFSLISEERLTAVLENLQAFTQIPIRLVDAGGAVLRRYGREAGYCRLLKENGVSQSQCQTQQMKAGQRAKALGGAYVFSCHANLTNIIYPLVHQDILLGSVLLGPFLMDSPESTLVSTLAEKHGFTPGLSLELYDELTGLQVIPPAKVGQLEKLTEDLLSPLVSTERASLLHKQGKLYQQSRLNETIQQYKAQSSSPSSEFFYEKQTQLLAKVRTGDMGQSKALLNELIGHVLFFEGGKLDAVRIRAIELTTLLSRVAMDSGARADSVYELNSKFLQMMLREQNMEELCYLLQEVVESFMDAAFAQKAPGNLYIRQALRFMADNYAQKLTLGAVSAHVGLSPNHFSTLFHKTMGISFQEHLSRLRVEESKRLLLNSQYSLNDIAIAMGFTDQSHYCKVFKRITGISPGKYRG